MNEQVSTVSMSTENEAHEMGEEQFPLQAKLVLKEGHPVLQPTGFRPPDGWVECEGRTCFHHDRELEDFDFTCYAPPGIAANEDLRFAYVCGFESGIVEAYYDALEEAEEAERELERDVIEALEEAEDALEDEE